MTVKKILLSFLFILAPFVTAEDWVYPGNDLKAGPTKIKAEAPMLVFKTSTSADKLSINLSNGKQKFGALNILVKNGENTYLRSRLLFTVPLSEAKKVKQGSPLAISSFSHLGVEYELSLVFNPKSPIPDTVVKKKIK